MYNKKGILMTLGLVFVSLTLLAFANVIVDHSETSEERIKEFGESERIYNLDNSISRTISRMVMRGMNTTHDISAESSLIRIKTQFANETQPYETEILDQFEILKNRTESNQNINFSLRRPFLGKNDFPISIEGSVRSLNPKNSSRFYLSNNLNMYIDLTTWPENMIYLNGFNETNTESINISIWSQDLKLYMAEETGNAIPPCMDCVNISINNYYQTNPVDQKVLGLKGAGLLMGSQEYYKDIFEVKVFGESLGWTDNITLTGNWVNSSESAGTVEEEYWPETTAGLAITLPDLKCSIGGGAFNFLYSGVGTQAHCLERSIDITVEVKLRDSSEAAQHDIYFVSPPSYGVGPPLLDTIGSGARLKYLN